MNKKTVRDVDFKGRRVLCRVDFNVPIKDGKVGDDTRITAALPTIQYVLDHGGSLVLMSHLGRPKGKGYEPEFSLKPVAGRLQELLGRPVKFGPDCIGAETAGDGQGPEARRGAAGREHPFLSGRGRQGQGGRYRDRRREEGRQGRDEEEAGRARGETGAARRRRDLHQRRLRLRAPRARLDRAWSASSTSRTSPAS